MKIHSIRSTLCFIFLLTGEMFASEYFRLDVGPYFSKKIGVSSHLGFTKQFDAWISLVTESGLTFLAKNEKERIDSASTIGNSITANNLKAFQRIYLIPAMIGIQVTFPIQFPFKPYAMASVGGNLAFESIREGESNNEKYINGYGGLAWRLGGGGTMKLGAISKFFLEAYVHWAKVYRFDQRGYFLQLTGFAMMVGFEFGKN